MRLLIVLVSALIGFAGSAGAADYRVLRGGDQLVRPALDQPVLRGSLFEPREPDFVRWDGYYAGAQFSWGSGSASFLGALRPFVADAIAESRDSSLMGLERDHQLSHWSVLGEAGAKGSGFGAFVGYNWQWQDTVVGVELNYTRTAINIVSPSFPIYRRDLFVGANTFDVGLSGTASLKLVDLATLRARAGWVYGSMMPYATAGIALGRANLRRSVTIDLIRNGVPLPSFNRSDNESVFMYGLAVGGGLEYALAAGAFLRGEYEFTQYMRIGNTRIAPHTHLLRAGGGMRF